MTYGGARIAAQNRAALGTVLETLQRDSKLPSDVLAVASNIANAIGALFEAEQASSEPDGKASVRHAMGTLSQTMALLQDVRGQHQGIESATRTLAEVMSALYGLAQSAPRASHAPTASGSPADPARSRATRRERLEANIGATTESNFYVGFSGDLAAGGVFIATYQSLPIDTQVELLVTLPGGFSKTLLGTIRFVRDPMDMQSEPGMGVGFDELDEEGRALILRFIRKRAPMFYEGA